MYRKYVFAYLVTDPHSDKAEMVLGTQEGLTYEDARGRLEQNIKDNFSEWNLANVLMMENPVEFIKDIENWN